MTLAADIEAERPALAESLLRAGASARTACGERGTGHLDRGHIVGGTSASPVRWLALRRTSTEVTLAGPSAPAQMLRAFEGHV
ncbi:hypothetical protein MTER_20760 [Mycolicibacter terrae]|uniref:Uncharacterized protein n=1 Tax=Mycolicibacter terrae TaxID=1788 RepID=A0AAD1HY42_9MYCO|nr:hypothetical protein [Mycolicibacter terrae]BBX22665.1 hypothetical protein MTER_20760 [Mycolicibacter terrae]